MKKLAELMREKNLTDSDLAKALGCQQSTIFQWKAGGFSPKANRIEPLCKLLDCTPNDLLGWGLKESTNISYAKREELLQAVTKNGEYDSQAIHHIASKFQRLSNGKITGFEKWLRGIAEVLYRIELTSKPKKADRATVQQLRLF